MDIVGLILTLVVAALVLMVVDRLNLGISVGGFLNAAIAAIGIAVVGWLVMWLLGTLGITMGSGILGLIVVLVVAAIVIMVAAAVVPGFEADGFVGAVIAAVAIGVIYWLISLVLPSVVPSLGA